MDRAHRRRFSVFHPFRREDVLLAELLAGDREREHYRKALEHISDLAADPGGDRLSDIQYAAEMAMLSGPSVRTRVFARGMQQ